MAIPTWKFLIPPQPKFHFILVRFSHFGLFRLILARALISVGIDRAKHLPYLLTLWLLSTTLPVTWMNPSHGRGCIFFVLSAGHSSVRFWIFLYLDLSFLFCFVSLDSWLGIGNDKGGLKKVSGFIFVGPYVIRGPRVGPGRVCAQLETNPPDSGGEDSDPPPTGERVGLEWLVIHRKHGRFGWNRPRWKIWPK